MSELSDNDLFLEKTFFSTSIQMIDPLSPRCSISHKSISAG